MELWNPISLEFGRLVLPENVCHHVPPFYPTTCSQCNRQWQRQRTSIGRNLWSWGSMRICWRDLNWGFNDSNQQLAARILSSQHWIIDWGFSYFLITYLSILALTISLHHPDQSYVSSSSSLLDVGDEYHQIHQPTIKQSWLLEDAVPIQKYRPCRSLRQGSVLRPSSWLRDLPACVTPKFCWRIPHAVGFIQLGASIKSSIFSWDFPL